MNAPSTDLATVLAGVGALGLTLASNLFSSQIPATPDALVALFDYSGGDPEQNVDYWRPSLQVRVRSAKGDYDTAYQLAMAIRAVLVAVNSVTVAGARYIGIWAKGDIMFLGRDNNDRAEFSINFEVHRTTAA